MYFIVLPWYGTRLSYFSTRGWIVAIRLLHRPKPSSRASIVSTLMIFSIFLFIIFHSDQSPCSNYVTKCHDVKIHLNVHPRTSSWDRNGFRETWGFPQLYFSTVLTAGIMCLAMKCVCLNSILDFFFFFDKSCQIVFLNWSSKKKYYL